MYKVSGKKRKGKANLLKAEAAKCKLIHVNTENRK